MILTRRGLLGLFPFLAFAADSRPGATIRGKLHIHEGAPPKIETEEHKTLTLEGDDTTTKVLGDPRLDGFDVQVRGHQEGADHFRVDPSHTRSMLVRKDGRLKLVTYWCDICSIRAYTPGPCVCCQRETTLDLRDPDQ